MNSALCIASEWLWQMLEELMIDVKGGPWGLGWFG